MNKAVLDNYFYHNIVDIITGLAIVICFFVYPQKAIACFALYVFHIFIKKKPDEREFILITKTYAYTFNFVIGILGLFMICCNQYFVPVLLLGICLLLRGVIGAVVFSYF